MAEAEKQTGGSEEKKGEFTSKLSHGRERFLAHVVEHALKCGRRTPEDFIRHFPPAVIMAGLRDRPSLRANILVTTTGIKFRIAVKKSAESAGQDLQIALDEAETSPDTVVNLFGPDDRVRYLSDKALWRFLIEGEFWNAPSSDAEASKRATEHVAFMLDRALQDELITHRDIIDGISVHRIAKLLPRSELEKIITAALTAGQKKRPFTEAGLVDAVSSQTLLEHVPLKDIWNSMIVPKIAQAHSFVEAPVETKRGESASADAADNVKKFSPANADPSGGGAAASAFRSGNGSAAEEATPKGDGPESPVDLDVDLDLDDISKELKAGVAK
jgi:hypothetical protein